MSSVVVRDGLNHRKSVDLVNLELVELANASRDAQNATKRVFSPRAARGRLIGIERVLAILEILAGRYRGCSHLELFQDYRDRTEAKWCERTFRRDIELLVGLRLVTKEVCQATKVARYRLDKVQNFPKFLRGAR